MFLSYNNIDHENPLEPLLPKKSSFFHHQHLGDHQYLKQDDNHHHHQRPFFFDFPDPFFDEHELTMPLNHILPHPMPPPKPESSNLIDNIHSEKPTKPETAKRAVKSAKKANNDNPPLKRRNPGKKDRHSKIRTAQGVRDRRMRLSLEIARKFFDLQDMLGYDKASSTIEWLFGKSKKSIKELMATTAKVGNNSSNFSVTESFLSECEAVSGVEVSSGNRRLGRKKTRKPNNNNVRESRAKARARARWRTREKMRVRLGFCNSSDYCQDDQRLGFCDDQLGVVDEGHSWNYTSMLSQDVGTIEKLQGSLSVSNNLFPVSDDYYQSCIDPSSNLMEFLGDWDMFSNGDDRLNSTNQVYSSMAEKVNSNYSDYSASNFPLFHQ